MLRLAFDFIITWRETRTRPNAYVLQGSIMILWQIKIIIIKAIWVTVSIIL